VGFSGTFLLARCSEPLNGLALVSAEDGEPAWLATEPGTDWQLLQVWQGVDVGADLAAHTGGPVLVAYVNDSDCATVQARTPEGVAWSGALDVESATGYESPFPWEPDPSVVIPAAVAWAAATGHKADPAALDEVFEAESDPFAEDLVHELAEALGFRFGDGVILP
jgi:hypothetical protein